MTWKSHIQPKSAYTCKYCPTRLTPPRKVCDECKRERKRWYDGERYGRERAKRMRERRKAKK